MTGRSSDVTHVIVKLTHPQPRQWMRFDDNYDDEYFGTAKELIMCKDCRYMHIDPTYESDPPVTAYFCSNFGRRRWVSPSCYCSWAERKEE